MDIVNSIKRKINIVRHQWSWKKHKTIFIHIPKAAGVSVNKAIYGQTLGHYYASELKNVIPSTFNQLFTFSVVRHPVERLYSAYSFAKSGGTNVMRMHNEKFYQDHKDFNSFESFILNWLSLQNLHLIDGVFRPQHLYIFDSKENLIIDKFYKLETINQNVDEISEKIGKKFILKKFNQTPSTKVKISQEIKHKIYELYEKDFILLNYKI